MPEPLIVELEEPEPVPVELLDDDGALAPLPVVPEADGEDVVPPEPDGVDIVLLLPEPDGVDIELPEPDVLGDAAGAWLSEIPATCIACWLHRSKSARLSVPPAMTPAGSSRAAIPTDATAIFKLVIVDLPP